MRQRDKRRKKQAEEYAADLENARLVQQKLLPKGPIEVRGLQVLGLHQSMQSVGGDYYDFFPLEDGRVLICVADVAGHGLPAALLMSNLQATLHAIAPQRRPINEMVALLNNEMVRRTSPDPFVTWVSATWLPMCPAPMIPSPPALLTAAAKRHPLHQIIPACMIGNCMPNNSVILFFMSFLFPNDVLKFPTLRVVL